MTDPTPAGIHALLKENRAAEAVEALKAMAPSTRAELFVRLRTPDQRAILTVAAPELGAAILADCDSATLSASMAQMDFMGMEAALQRVPPDDLADLLLHLPAAKATELKGYLDPAMVAEVEGLMQFDPGTAGGLMTTRYLSVPDAVTVGRAVELLRKARDGDAASYVYVVDSQGKLAGTVGLRALLMADARQPIREIARTTIVRVKAGAPREELVRTFGEHHFVSLPVVDEKDRLVGIVTSDDVMEAMRQAEGEVVRGVTGADPREALKETLAATRSRLPWATITVAGGLACAFIGGLFQKTLADVVVLGIFIPVVLALGESIGAQTVSVVLSTLSSGELPRAKLGSFLAKEVLIGAVVGLYAGLLVSSTSLLWHGEMRIGLVIGGAVAVSVAWAACMAVVIPSVMRRMKMNATIASGPLVLTLVDISTLVVYLGGATVVL